MTPPNRKDMALTDHSSSSASGLFYFSLSPEPSSMALEPTVRFVDLQVPILDFSVDPSSQNIFVSVDGRWKPDGDESAEATSQALVRLVGWRESQVSNIEPHCRAVKLTRNP